MKKKMFNDFNAMRALMLRFRTRVANGERYAPDTLAQGRIAFLQMFTDHNLTVERAIRRLPTASPSGSALASIREHGARLQALRLRLSAHIGAWTPGAIEADWNGYVASTLNMHAQLEDHMAFEQRAIFPLIDRIVCAPAAPAINGRASSTDPASPAPRHTIAGCSSASTPSGSR